MAALRNGERKQAYLDLVAAMALNPADPATPAALGAAMNELRLFRFSVPVLKLATQLNQDDAGALDDLAFAYRCLGQQGDAERTLEALVPETTGAGGIVAAERKALRDGRGPLPIRLSPGSQEPPAPAPRMSPKE
jgi:predicted Zn-dependent protease